MANRRVRRFEVEGLFGLFNHTVRLNLNDRITIIHGPNGYGKTVMLGLLAGVFGRGNAVLRSTPFTRMAVEFESGSTLTVRKEQAGSSKSARRRRPALPDLLFVLDGDEGGRKEARIPGAAQRPLGLPLGAIEHEVPELERVGARLWQYLPTGEILGIDEVLDRFHVGPFSEGPEATEKAPWLADLRASVPIHVIKAQRLLIETRPRSSREFDRRPELQPAVTVYASELAGNIQAKLADYANLSQSLDRTFPFRVVKEERSPDLTSDALKQELASLEARRGDLREAGLLDAEGDIGFPTVDQVDEEKRSLLAVYVTDSQQKLAIFDDLARKTELMKKIINSRFLHKNVEINREEGIRVRTDAGTDLPLTSLSSGEQHELVLLYELLFRVGEGSMILLDEPELSLHVEWQSPFLDDLKEIADLRFLDVVVATHSPQIIGDRWELTVQLRGPGD